MVGEAPAGPRAYSKRACLDLSGNGAYSGFTAPGSYRVGSKVATLRISTGRDRAFTRRLTGVCRPTRAWSQDMPSANVPFTMTPTPERP